MRPEAHCSCPAGYSCCGALRVQLRQTEREASHMLGGHGARPPVAQPQRSSRARQVGAAGASLTAPLAASLLGAALLAAAAALAAGRARALRRRSVGSLAPTGSASSAGSTRSACGGAACPAGSHGGAGSALLPPAWPPGWPADPRATGDPEQGRAGGQAARAAAAPVEGAGAAALAAATAQDGQPARPLSSSRRCAL